jgi:hypothetical protein
MKALVLSGGARRPAVPAWGLGHSALAPRLPAPATGVPPLPEALPLIPKESS